MCLHLDHYTQIIHLNGLSVSMRVRVCLCVCCIPVSWIAKVGQGHHRVVHLKLITMRCFVSLVYSVFGFLFVPTFFLLWINKKCVEDPESGENKMCCTFDMSSPSSLNPISNDSMMQKFNSNQHFRFLGIHLDVTQTVRLYKTIRVSSLRCVKSLWNYDSYDTFSGTSFAPSIS